MKKILCFFLIAIFSRTYAQQNFEKAFHTEFNYTETNLLQYQGNLYFASVKLFNTNSVASLDIYSFSGSGIPRFKKSFPYSEGLKTAKLSLSPDNKILLTGYYYTCDVSGQEIPFILKLDTNGQVLMSKTYTTAPVKGNKIIDGFQRSNGDFFLATNNKLLKFNAAGVYSTTIGAFDSIFCITPLATGNLILLNGTSQFYGQGLSCFTFSENPAFSTINSYTTSIRCKKIIPNKGSYFGLTGNGLVHRLDTAFQSTSNTNLLQNFSSGNRTQDFTIANDTVYLTGNNITTPLTYYSVCDTMLSAIGYTSNTSPLIKPAGITVNNSDAFILNNNPGATGKISHISLLSFPKNTGYTYINDVKLASIAIDSTFPINTYTTNGYPFVDIAFKAKVKNAGSAIINSFFLSADIGSPNGPCYPRLFHKLYQNTNLLPGDSITVFTGSLTNIPQTSSFPYSTYLPNMCFIVTAPNKEIDKNATDNILCPNISLSPNSIDENFLKGNTITIFPNPASNSVTITGENISEVYISDALGRLCYRGTHNIINTENLEAGVYFVTVLQLNGHKETSKLIIQR